MKLSVLILIFCLCFQPAAFCFWGDLPLPSATRELKKEKMELVGREGMVITYSSWLSFRDIVDFYRINLVNAGWKEVLAADEIKKHLGPAVLDKMLIFQKEDDLITIKFNSENGQKTEYVLLKNKTLPSEEEFKRMQAEKAKDTWGIPVYPGAEINPLACTGQHKGYSTKDSAEAVLKFYADKMSALGWETENITPIDRQELDAQSLDNCPECRELLKGPLASLQEKIKGGYMDMGQIEFSKKGESCIVGVTQTVFPDNDNTEDNTLISIIHNKD